MKRVAPSVGMKEEVDGILGGTAVGATDPMKGFIRSLARYILQVHIEEEATEFLGRGRYQRGQRHRAGLRNGYEGTGLQTEAGLIDLRVPQLRGTEERFRSPLLRRLGNLSDPLMVIFDGAPGLKKAIRRVWPKAFRQRCQVHKMRNILAKLPKGMQGRMKKLVHQVFRAPSYEEALKRGRTLMARFTDRYSARNGHA